AWVEALVGGQALGGESIKRHLARWKAELLDPHPTAVERVLVDSLAVAYLALRHSEVAAARTGSQSLGQAALRLRRRETAQRAFWAALKSLVRRGASAAQGLVPASPLKPYEGEEPRQGRRA